jgi:hypothetical protein
MHLTADYIHPTPRGGRCRIRTYLPDEQRDAVVVICTELANNPGASVTNTLRRIAAEVIESHRLPTPLVWIEHHPPETTAGHSESFEMVLFDSYEVRERRAPYMGTGSWRSEAPPGRSWTGPQSRC